MLCGIKTIFAEAAFMHLSSRQFRGIEGFRRIQEKKEIIQPIAMLFQTKGICSNLLALILKGLYSKPGGLDCAEKVYAGTFCFRSGTPFAWNCSFNWVTCNLQLLHREMFRIPKY
jgi:hypothetical protein